MRLWSIHPKYLDTKGLLAVWREGLLAQKVLAGNTKGYTNHPQLQRFKDFKDPLIAIATYLHAVCDEADIRGYTFQRDKLLYQSTHILIPVTLGQILYEWDHLQVKLAKRDPQRYEKQKSIQQPKQHPLFIVIPGGIAPWEKVNTHS